MSDHVCEPIYCHVCEADFISENPSPYFRLHARIAELERQLESARSLAVDRDQRLARIAELIDSATVIPVAHESGRTRIVNAWRIARGLEEENA